MRRRLHACLFLSLLLSAATHSSYAQVAYPSSPDLSRSVTETQTVLPSNSISHIVTSGQDLWIGTSKGAARSRDGAASWENFASVPAFVKPGIYAIAVRGDTIWCSTGYTHEVLDQDVPTGTGYAFSFDGGVTWASAPQPIDPRGDSTYQYGDNTVYFLPVVVPEQNVSYDVAIGHNEVWVASWASGLRHLSGNDTAWQRTVLPNKFRNSIAPTDTLVNYQVNPRSDNNFLAFSVAVETDSIIWAGTAGGINRSTDGGASWRKFTSINQTKPILGDWVIAISVQRFRGATTIWTTNWPAEGASQRYGVSASTDGGETWTNFLHDIKAYGFAFRDSVVYIATTEGLYRTSDGGSVWTQSGAIVDDATGERNLSSTFFAVGAIGETVYGGNGEGLVWTNDGVGARFGDRWSTSRSYVSVGTQGGVYAYPNPFSPRFEVTRIHYGLSAAQSSVTVELFDFGMNRVRTVVKDAARTPASEHDDVWDGKNDDGSIVPNGVYFYRVLSADDDARWGKILVVQ